MPKRAYLAAAVGLLLIQFLIRTNHITRLEPYVDEGTHMMRAAQVWHFETNPGRFSNGKLLVYFWLGLFVGPLSTNLAAGRLGIALFSALTGATLCLLGRWLRSPATGLLALAAYACLPLAFFLERMALADPFATGFAALVAWRSLVFARRPDARRGLVLGLLLGLASMAKLTMALLPLLPLTAVLLHDHQAAFKTLVRRYLPGLMLAALVVGLMWAPILIPAYFAQQAGDPFVIVNEFNIQRDDPFAPAGPGDYLVRVLPLIAEFTSPLYLIGAGLALVAGLLRGQRRSQAVFLIVWLLALALPVVLAARVVTVRYLMPIAAPLTLALAFGVDDLLRAVSSAVRPVLRAGAALAAAAWLGAFALPFALTAPLNLTLHGNNQFDFQSGFLTADDRVREAAHDLTDTQPAGPVYATREACHMLYFYSDRIDLRCLADDPIPAFGQRIQNELNPGEIAYLVMSWYYGPFHLGIDWLHSEEIPLATPPRFQGPGYEFRLWKIWIDAAHNA